MKIFILIFLSSFVFGDGASEATSGALSVPTSTLGDYTAYSIDQVALQMESITDESLALYDFSDGFLSDTHFLAKTLGSTTEMAAYVLLAYLRYPVFISDGGTTFSVQYYMTTFDGEFEAVAGISSFGLTTPCLIAVVWLPSTYLTIVSPLLMHGRDEVYRSMQIRKMIEDWKDGTLKEMPRDLRQTVDEIKSIDARLEDRNVIDLLQDLTAKILDDYQNHTVRTRVYNRDSKLFLQDSLALGRLSQLPPELRAIFYSEKGKEYPKLQFKRND